jgi:hypothetical protein
MSFDDQFLDYDFTKDVNYVPGDLGLLVADRGGLCGASYEDVEKILTDKEIDAAIEMLESTGTGCENLVTRIFNQSREGSCVANAFGQAHENRQALQFGKNRVTPVSPMSLYKRIGRSASSGAYVGDGIKELTSRGILPLDTPENRAKFGDHVMSHTGFSQRMPAGWESTGKLFAGGEYHIVESLRGIFTALVNQHPVIVGRQGHSICYLRPTGMGRNRRVLYVNSWGNWGSAAGDFDFGFGYDSLSAIKQSASWAVALRTVKAVQL